MNKFPSRFPTQNNDPIEPAGLVTADLPTSPESSFRGEGGGGGGGLGAWGASGSGTEDLCPASVVSLNQAVIKFFGNALYESPCKFFTYKLY